MDNHGNVAWALNEDARSSYRQITRYQARVRAEAQRVYEERIRENRPGDANSDWFEAERRIDNQIEIGRLRNHIEETIDRNEKVRLLVLYAFGIWRGIRPSLVSNDFLAAQDGDRGYGLKVAIEAAASMAAIVLPPYPDEVKTVGEIIAELQAPLARVGQPPDRGNDPRPVKKKH